MSGVDQEKRFNRNFKPAEKSLPHPSVVCSVTPRRVMEIKFYPGHSKA